MADHLPARATSAPDADTHAQTQAHTQAPADGDTDGDWGRDASARSRLLGADGVPLLILLGFGAVCVAALGLVGGVAGASVGGAVLVGALFWGTRWALGASGMDSGYRRRTRLAVGREPTLRYWGLALSDAANTPEGYGLHLYPLLLRLYEVRLAEQHGISLRAQPERAAAVIGRELWPWLDPRLPRTPRALRVARAAGTQDLPISRPVPQAVLEALVARLESL
ncbi:hypothetical protein [Streptacidiphilus sp. MAP5-3]|uniref:hypothetical protein n=1 Tax=unclassified Streptacidiphilus TaxID=2643834 RepID=UPI003516CF3D